MPLLLKANQYSDWLCADNKKAEKCIKTYSAKKMRAIKISTYVNNPHNNDVKCVEKLD